MKKLEMLIGRVVLNILGGVIMAGLIIGIFALLGLLVQVIETHFWLMIPLVLIVSLPVKLPPVNFKYTSS